MITEAKIVEAIISEVYKRGGKTIKIHGNAFQESGTPDVIGILEGKMLAIECKIPGEEPTKIQKYRLTQWAKAGAITGVAHSLDEFKTIIGVK